MVTKCTKTAKSILFAYCQFYIMCSFCVYLFSVIGKNLAPEGKAYQSYALRGNNASKANDGQTTNRFSRNKCAQSLQKKRAWWRVDWKKLVEVYAVEIMPGKLM